MDYETTKRISNMKEEFNGKIDIKTFQNEFEYKGIVIQKGIGFTALCEHHHVAFSGEAIVGYLPKDRVMGLSKVVRIVEKFFNPIIYTLQEKGTQQIADYFRKNFDCNGAIVLVKAKHGCIAYRGVKKDTETVTFAFNGDFENSEKRKEFFNLLNI